MELKLFVWMHQLHKKSGDFWKKMKPLLPSSGTNKYGNIILLENEQVCTDPSIVAEIFNEYFVNIAAVIESSVDDHVDDPSIKTIAERNVMINNFFFDHVSDGYIRDILDKLNPNKAVGVDGISSRLLRLSTPVLADEITKLINYL